MKKQPKQAHTYTIQAKCSALFTYTIEATSEEEARRIAEELGLDADTSEYDFDDDFSVYGVEQKN